MFGFFATFGVKQQRNTLTTQLQRQQRMGTPPYSILFGKHHSR